MTDRAPCVGADTPPTKGTITVASDGSWWASCFGCGQTVKVRATDGRLRQHVDPKTPVRRHALGG